MMEASGWNARSIIQRKEGKVENPWFREHFRGLRHRGSPGAISPENILLYFPR